MTKKLLKRNTPTEEKSIAEQLVEEGEEPLAIRPYEGDFDNVISTGSTALDLAISGDRIRGGGIPLGILVEVFGPSGIGKTAILSNTFGDVQRKGGKGTFKDPEGRMDRAYAQIYGASIDKSNYSQPDTVNQVFEEIDDFTEKQAIPGKPNAIATDSLAALSTEKELTEGDKRGQLRAKQFSEGFRKSCRKIKQAKTSLICSNQLRQGDYGHVTPGGMAIEFYASLRIKLGWPPPNTKKRFLDRTVTFHGKGHKIIYGHTILADIVKNSTSTPHRTCWIYLINNYGIDDIRGNLQMYKEMANENLYICPDGKEYQAINNAIEYIEKNNLEFDLREMTIDIWEEFQRASQMGRKRKY